MDDSTEEPESAPDEQGSKEVGRKLLPDWFDIPVWLGIAGILAFSTSWIYVHIFSLVLGLDLPRYFDVLDYVQITPIGGVSFIVILLVVLSIGVCLLSGIRKFYRALNRRELLLKIGAIAVFLLPLFSSLSVALFETYRIKGSRLSVVLLKGDHPRIQGRVIFSLNRYLLVYGKHGALIAIPQTEIQMIKRCPRGQVLPPESSVLKATPSPTTSAAN